MNIPKPALSLSGTADPAGLLSIYLNDHHAGATVGVELARRLRSSNENDPAFGPALAELCGEIEADRVTLERLMERLGVTCDPVKSALAWAAEKLGRLKLNGQLSGYSPLSRLLELELLLIGITGKLQMWQALAHTMRRVDDFDFEQLAQRAEGQRGRVDELHLAAAALALP